MSVNTWASERLSAAGYSLLADDFQSGDALSLGLDEVVNWGQLKMGDRTVVARSQI
jgi:hypothetical protein